MTHDGGKSKDNTERTEPGWSPSGEVPRAAIEAAREACLV